MSRKQSLLIAEIPHLRRYARALTRDVDAADDLVQACLERALSRWHLWQSHRKLRSWLFAILHNLHIDTVRHRSARATHLVLADEIDLPSSDPGPDSGLAVAGLMAAIERLPADQRDAVLMVGVNELSYAEAAEALGIPLGTLMSRLHRGRGRLRELLNMTGEKPAIRRVK
ncbi:MAG: RNA polymerase subunit sigma-24 [Hyphomicrobiales bacterium]|nr:MAG: RNA polymerase subunit sigma-24 [Hyphomicrobiales bacterium]